MATVEVVDNTDVLTIKETLIEVVEVQTGGVQGPAGPQGGGISSGTLAARPASSSEGDLYAATDTDEVFIWFD